MTDQPEPNSIPVSEDSSESKPKNKKRRRLFIIIGAVALILRRALETVTRRFRVIRSQEE